MCERERTDGQVGDEEVGDGAERLEAVDDVDDQRITQNPQHDDGAVGQDQHHLQTSTDTQRAEQVTTAGVCIWDRLQTEIWHF